MWQTLVLSNFAIIFKNKDLSQLYLENGIIFQIIKKTLFDPARREISG